MIDLNLLTIPKWVNWIAQDCDGVVWGYQTEPLQHFSGWYENEVGHYIKLCNDDKNPHWQQSLIAYRP